MLCQALDIGRSGISPTRVSCSRFAGVRLHTSRCSLGTEGSLALFFKFEALATPKRPFSTG
eukprot:4415822-Amphidinium_carterae.1